MFYGEIIHPGKPVAYVPPPDDTLQLHLSSAALAADAPDGARVSLMVRAGDDEPPVALCTLTAGRLDTVALDQFLSHYAELTVVGSDVPVHLTGYYAPSFDVPPGTDDDDDGEDGDDEDDDEDDEEGGQAGLSDSEDAEDEDSDDEDDGDAKQGKGRVRLTRREARALLAAAGADDDDDDDDEEDEDEDGDEDSDEDPMLADLEEAADVVLRAHGGGVGSESASDDSDEDDSDSDSDEEEDEEDGLFGGRRTAPSVVIEDITYAATTATGAVKAAAAVAADGKKTDGKTKESKKQQQQPQPQQPQQQPQQQKQPKAPNAAAAPLPARGEGKKRGKEEAAAAASATAAAAAEAPPAKKRQTQADGGGAATIAAAAKAPPVPAKKANVRRWENGFAIEDLATGPPGGKIAASGRQVAVRYTGRLGSAGGKVFDSNAKPGGRPLKFRVGTGSVVPGFDRGTAGMRVGDKRRVTIPAAMGYGAQRMGSIPPNSTLVFDIEVLGVE